MKNRTRFSERIGQKFNQLTILRINPDHKYHFICLCDCGKEKSIRCTSVINEHTKSCGCWHKKIITSHGLYKHPLYKIHLNMMDRCYNPKCKAYKNYGGRLIPITVYKEWHNVVNFVRDVEPLRIPGLTMDRRENNGNYEPGNIEFTTPKVQSNNKRNNVLREYNGRTQTLAQWADEYDIKRNTFWARLYKHNWDMEKALHKNERILIEYKGEIKSITEFSKEFNINNTTLYTRIFENKWPVEKALITPIRYNKKQHENYHN